MKDLGEIDWEQLRDYMVDDLDGQVDPEIEGRIVDLEGEDPGDEDDPVENADELIKLVDKGTENGEINDAAGSLLSVHLRAVSHYEGKQKTEKVIKHLNSFRQLLDHELEKDNVSEAAYQSLMTNTDGLIDRWEEDSC